MKTLLKLLKIPKSSAGFTLIELLVAMTITTIVIGITGWGVVAITQKSKEQKVETDRRVELNRTLDFIADEFRRAKKVELNAEAASVPGFTASPEVDATTVQKILVMDVGTEKVVYYIASPNSVNTSVWSGPNVIYRWGPAFDSSGEYTATNSNTLLVDLIDNGVTSPNCSGWSQNPPTNPTGFYACVDSSGKIADIHLRGELEDAYGNPRDPLEVSSKVFARPFEIASGSTSGGTSTTSGGTTSGGTSTTSGGTSTTSGGITSGGTSTTSGGTTSGGTSTTSGGTTSGGTSTTSGGTSTTSGGTTSGGTSTTSGGTSTTSGGTSTTSGGITSGGTSTTSGGTTSGGTSTTSGGTTSGGTPSSQPFTTNNGTVTFTQNLSVQIQVLGGDIRCGATGPVIPTTTTSNVTSGAGTVSTTLTSTTQTLNVSAGSTLTITGAAPRTSLCSGFAGSSYNSATDSAATNRQQVLTLRNGDTPPLFSPYGNQRATIQSFLTNYINPATGRVTIADNQVIYLFELGVPYDPTKTTQNAAYDMQDLVVLANIVPNTVAMCTVPAINGLTNTNANTQIIANRLVPQQNTVTTGTRRSARNQSPSATTSVRCGSTVTYDYRE